MNRLTCRVCKWINKRITFELVAIMAHAAGVPVRSLVALHPSFNLTEQDERVLS